MNIDFKALTLDLTDEIRAYTVEKLDAVEKLLGDTQEENIRYEVELEKDSKHQTGDVYRADITVLAGVEKTHAVGHGETVMAALDEAKDELTRRVRRDKTKRMDFVRKGGSRIKKMLRFWE